MQEIKVTRTCDACGQSVTGSPSEIMNSNIHKRAVLYGHKQWITYLCDDCYKDMTECMESLLRQYNFKLERSSN